MFNCIKLAKIIQTITIMSPILKAILLILPIISCQFISETSDQPKIGGDILLQCELRAPEGLRFVSTTPELTVNGSVPFTCDKLQAVMEDSRFNGMHMPDFKLTNLSCRIAILYIQEADLWLNFTCFQVLDNGSIIQHSITLNNTKQLPTCSEMSNPKGNSSFNLTSPVFPNNTATPNTSDHTAGIIAVIIVFLLMIFFAILSILLFIIIIYCFIRRKRGTYDLEQARTPTEEPVRDKEAPSTLDTLNHNSDLQEQLA